MDKLLYIRGPVQAEITEKKSRFITNIVPVENEEQALMFIDSIRKKYYDARHNCYAYITGDNDEFTHCSDDGEPSHTAGRPMLEVLKGAGLHKVCVTVTRYFGGILLGTGGLVRAYQGAVKAAIDGCEIYELAQYRRIHICTDYPGHGKISFMAQSEGYIINNLVYTDKVELDLCVPPEKEQSAVLNVTSITNGRASIEIGELFKA